MLLTAGYSDLKIGGFGTARFIETGNQLADLTHCGVELQSPEVVTLHPITTAADIWSMGDFFERGGGGKELQMVQWEQSLMRSAKVI